MTAATSSTVDAETLQTWLLYVLAPALVGTGVYWYVSDASVVETAVFAVAMAVMILVMDYFFDTMPDE